MFTKDGVFRKFAYIGYKSPKEAASAVKYFNQTFIDTTKIQVELALGIGDPTLPRPWSKHSHSFSTTGIPTFKVIKNINSPDMDTDPNSNTSSEPNKTSTPPLSKIDALQMELKKRQLLQDYLNSSKTKTWANDEPINVSIEAVKNKKPGGQGTLLRSHVVFDPMSDDEEYQTLPSLSSSTSVVSSLLPTEIELDKEKHTSTSSILSNTQLNTPPITCQKSMTSNSQSSSFLEEEFKSDESFSTLPNALEETSPSAVPSTSKSRLPDPERDIPLIEEHRRLLILNLPYTATEQELTTHFETCGKLSDVHIPLFKDTHQPKGLAFITYVNATEAVQAYYKFQSSSFQGRLLRVLGASPLPTHPNAPPPMNFKEKRAQVRQEEAMKQTHEWNPLFMHANTVADVTAQQLGISKSDLMDPSKEDLAVQLALSETQYVHHTLAFFKELGISIKHFEKGQPRSNQVLLIKHISNDVTVDHLQQWFQRFGPLGRVLMPSFGMFALVEFLVPQHATSAFRHSAYKKLGMLPMYLEWAPPLPENTSTAPKNHPHDETTMKYPKQEGENKRAHPIDDEEDEEEDVLSQDPTKCNATLLVRNVPFEATAKELKQLFSAVAQVKRLRLPKKVTGGHRGFAFIDFLTSSEAGTAKKALSHTHLYGRKLVLEFAQQEVSLHALRAHTKVIGRGHHPEKKKKIEVSEPKRDLNLSDEDDDDDDG
ncbi:hypothetical protein HMI54_007857 [Coelomomyces lativittatus]|nr:hypothetical protein HMI54_007857 [Coelomomyces lativittatus]